jgi:hypothetical protein
MMYLANEEPERKLTQKMALTHNSVNNNKCDVTYVLKEPRRRPKCVIHDVVTFPIALSTSTSYYAHNSRTITFKCCAHLPREECASMVVTFGPLCIPFIRAVKTFSRSHDLSPLINNPTAPSHCQWPIKASLKLTYIIVTFSLLFTSVPVLNSRAN